jgi:hypothetical protein
VNKYATLHEIKHKYTFEDLIMLNEILKIEQDEIKELKKQGQKNNGR